MTADILDPQFQLAAIDRTLFLIFQWVLEIYFAIEVLGRALGDQTDASG
jgi:hypothetical protein